jgi:Dyp-type peroxidase family
VQSGIIEPYAGASHGCLLLLGLRDARAAQRLLQALEPHLCSAEDQRSDAPSSGRCYANVAFTFRGLEVAGVPAGTLAQLPPEFREGMGARAGILGDVRHNHPTRWPLPARNGPAFAADTGRVQTGRVQMSSVHALVQFVMLGAPSHAWQDLVGNDTHPLAPAVKGFQDAVKDCGVRILSVESMQRFPARNGTTRDHFGFVDGLSQPTLNANGGRDAVAPGDLLLGYRNSLGDPPSLRGRLWDDSTFLVVRKLRQHLDAWHEVLLQAGRDADEVKSKMMGRRPDGRNLIDDSTGNDFDFRGDPEGRACPFQSHVRRANPRTPRDELPLADLVAIPRILRRGMSYGPRYSEKEKPGVERGVVFMAYNASIAEQFEVIQSWLSGGNSSGEHAYSALRDPMLGVAQDDDPHTFLYFVEDGGRYERRALRLPEQPLVTVEWGEYFYVPSMRALGELATVAREVADADAEAEGAVKKRGDDNRKAQLAGVTARGAALIARLQQVRQSLGEEEARTQWKVALEDFGAITSGVSEAIWAAIRELHSGVLATPYGVLVCSKKFVDEVFESRNGRYTVSGYAERMRQSFGEIYLGRDAGDAYSDEANAANSAIMAVSTEEAFASAFQATADWLRRLPRDEARRVEVKDIVGHALAEVSRRFFGLPDGVFVVAGWHWRPGDPPACPRHFNSPSRYFFQPNPGPEATRVGQNHGQALKEKVLAFVAANRGDAAIQGTRISGPLFSAFRDDERLASTLIGAMMGFLPTVDGNLRNVLFEWVTDGSLWDHQADYLADPGADDLAKAQRILFAPMRESMQRRPVPPIVWRTACEAHELGNVAVKPGDRIAVSIVAATQEALLERDHDIFTVFGGNRGGREHPTHACPGYRMAIGVMLGVLAGLVATAELRPTLTPLSLKVKPRA